MITLHHLENSQSIRILWLLEELGAPYEMKMYDRDPKTLLAPQEYKSLSPLGTAPVVTDGALVLAETNAIIDHLIDQGGEAASALRPEPGAPERTRYLFWFHAAQGSLQPLLTIHFVFNRLKTKAPALVRPVLRAALGQAEKLFLNPRLEALLRLAEADLAKSEWLAGDRLTAADIVMGYSLEMAAARAGMDQGRHPNAHRFLARMKARPAYQRALARDGKFDPLAG